MRCFLLLAIKKLWSLLLAATISSHPSPVIVVVVVSATNASLRVVSHF